MRRSCWCFILHTFARIFLILYIRILTIYFTTVSQTQLAIGNFHSVSSQSRSWRLTSQCDDKSNKLNLCLHLSLVKPHICLSWISNMTAVPQRKGEGSPVGMMMQGGKVLAVMLAYKTCYGIFWYRKIMLEKKNQQEKPWRKRKILQRSLLCWGMWSWDPGLWVMGRAWTAATWWRKMPPWYLRRNVQNTFTLS